MLTPAPVPPIPSQYALKDRSGIKLLGEWLNGLKQEPWVNETSGFWRRGGTHAASATRNLTDGTTRQAFQVLTRHALVQLQYVLYTCI